jgi:transforming growth factor-beta-induced protein
MKKIALIYRRALWLALSGLFMLTSCQAPQLVEPAVAEEPGELQVNLSPFGNSRRPTRSIVDIAVSNPDFSALVAAVTVTGLVPTLADEHTRFTVFAPTNAAFAQLPAPFNTAQSIAAITDQATLGTLRNILLYHVVIGQRPSKSLRRGAPATTAKPQVGNTDNVLYFSNARGSLFVNGQVEVVLADVAATNGLIHAISSVLIPPSQSIVGIAVGNPNFSALVAAVLKTDLAATLSENLFTVFAPTDAAFAQLPAPFNTAQNIAQIRDAQQIETLRQILLLHVADGQPVFAPDLRPGRFVTLGGLVSIDLQGGATVQGGANEQPANIVAVNILANNGVIHVIDQVLLPRERGTKQ